MKATSCCEMSLTSRTITCQLLSEILSNSQLLVILTTNIYFHVFCQTPFISISEVDP
mgnify:CR=1 FL=1